MSEQDFFEELRRQAGNKLYGEWNQKGDLTIGIEATIEALKEMMVREPVVYKAHHGYSPLYLRLEEETGGYDGRLPGTFQDDPRNEPEEVYILVLRKEKKDE